MSLQGIFDPVVRAYFENKYANSGGGAATLDTGRCASTKNVFVLEVTPDFSDLESFVDSYGDTVYKVADVSPFFNGSLFNARVSLIQYQLGDDNHLELTGNYDLSYNADYTHASGCAKSQSGANLMQVDHTIGVYFCGQVFWHHSGDEFMLYAVQTAEAAAQYGFPSPGVYVAPYMYEGLDRKWIILHSIYGAQW